MTVENYKGILEICEDTLKFLLSVMFNVWILERLYAVKGCPRSDCFILLPEGGRQWSQGAFG